MLPLIELKSILGTHHKTVGSGLEIRALRLYCDSFKTLQRGTGDSLVVMDTSISVSMNTFRRE